MTSLTSACSQFNHHDMANTYLMTLVDQGHVYLPCFRTDANFVYTLVSLVEHRDGSKMRARAMELYEEKCENDASDDEKL